jgi:cytochrome P450
MAEMRSYFLDLVRERRQAPRAGLLSLLASARLGVDSALTDTQIVMRSRQGSSSQE